MSLQYPALDDKGRQVISPEPQTASKTTCWEGTSFGDTSPTVDKETYSTPISFSEAMDLVGAEAYYEGGTIGDWVRLEVVDLDDITGLGAGTVVGNFGERIYMYPGVHPPYISEAVKELPAGLYLRILHHSSGTAEWKMVVNYKMKK